MSEYDSQKWNLFRYPLIWFLIAAAFAQAIIVFNSPPTHAANSATAAVMSTPAPEVRTPIFHDSWGSTPAKVELPKRQEIKHSIVTKAAPAATPPPETTVRASSSTETVIQFAMNQLGKPYRWGAAGPSSYDCSGLVMIAFSKIGLRLPHYTGALISFGKSVAKPSLQRGDIVFPSSGHVGIYLGGGKFIHAPQPGEVVKISAVYAFYAARRLV